MGFGDQEKVLSGHGGIGRPVRNPPSPVRLQAVTRFVGFGVAIGVSAAIGQHQNGDGGGEYAGLSLREPGGGAEGLESGGGVAPDEEMRALRKACRGSPTSEITPVKDRLDVETRRETTGHAPSRDERRQARRIVGLDQVRRPNFARSSAIVQPCTINTPPTASETSANNERTSGEIFSGLADS